MAVNLMLLLLLTQKAEIGIENGTSGHISLDQLSDPTAFAGAYISQYAPDTLGELPSARSWAFGLNGQTLAFNASDFIAKFPKSSAEVRIRDKNLKAIALLEKWFSEPDDLGPSFWEKFDKDLEANRFTI